MVDVALALESLIPAAEYSGSLTENTKAAYDAVVWSDDRPKPTWAAISKADGPAQDAVHLEVVRAERDRRLAACDWTQISDVSLSAEKKSAWAAYRQALRDLPSAVDAANPTWPPTPA